MIDNNQGSVGHSDMDYAEHDATYHLFLKLLKYLVGLVILILVFLAFMWG